MILANNSVRWWIIKVIAQILLVPKNCKMWGTVTALLALLRFLTINFYLIFPALPPPVVVYDFPGVGNAGNTKEHTMKLTAIHGGKYTIWRYNMTDHDRLHAIGLPNEHMIEHMTAREQWTFRSLVQKYPKTERVAGVWWSLMDLTIALSWCYFKITPLSIMEVPTYGPRWPWGGI